MTKRMQKRMNRLGHTSFNPSEHRKHRRAKARLIVACNINGINYQPGDKVVDNSSKKTQSFMMTAGGSVRFH